MHRRIGRRAADGRGSLPFIDLYRLRRVLPSAIRSRRRLRRARTHDHSPPPYHVNGMSRGDMGADEVACCRICPSRERVELCAIGHHMVDGRCCPMPRAEVLDGLSSELDVPRDDKEIRSRPRAVQTQGQGAELHRWRAAQMLRSQCLLPHCLFVYLHRRTSVSSHTDRIPLFPSPPSFRCSYRRS